MFNATDLGTTTELRNNGFLSLPEYINQLKTGAIINEEIPVYPITGSPRGAFKQDNIDSQEAMHNQKKAKINEAQSESTIPSAEINGFLQFLLTKLPPNFVIENTLNEAQQISVAQLLIK